MLSRPEPTRSVGARLRVLTLLLYVTLDCANPLMAGAVCFDPDTSVEAVTFARSFPSAGASLTAPVVGVVPPAPTPARLGVGAGVSVAPAPAGAVAPRARAGRDLVGDPTPEDG